MFSLYASLFSILGLNVFLVNAVNCNLREGRFSRSEQ
jgi:hypothetical protein